MTQRIRDPLHDLIEFEPSNQLEAALWRVLQTRPFQRLRRVKQLGFSELVYPGACHTRFAHSVGVFHTARQLMKVVRKHTGERQESREKLALAASLLHDLGHGPFSHAFEKVGKRLKLRLADHEDMSDRLIRDGEVADILNTMGSGFANDVADIIKREGVKTVHNAVVSSQFDADRLDYMRRDRMMTGSQHAAIDYVWLMANLQLASIPGGLDNEREELVETFVLGPKAIHAAEAYVLGLFQLYPTVYFHKATPGAEKIFTELLVRVVQIAKQGDAAVLGLPDRHPLIRFSQSPEDIDTALCLDDMVVWGALSMMTESTDSLTCELADRLRDRKLYKCYDIRSAVEHALDPGCARSPERIAAIDQCCSRISAELTGWIDEREANVCRIIIDTGKRSPYETGGSKRSIDQIYVLTEAGTPVDLKERSQIVNALSTFKLLRAYHRAEDDEAIDLVERITKGELAACRARF